MRIPAFVLAFLLATACSDSSLAGSGQLPPTPNASASAITAPAPGVGASSTPVVDDEPALYTNDAGGDTVRRFASPSGNIRCALESSDDVDWVTCLVRQRTWDGPSCRAGEVASIALVADAHASPDVTCGQDGTESYRTIPYGHAITEIAITCTSRRNGMTCRVGEHGHGFVVSRERFRSY